MGFLSFYHTTMKLEKHLLDLRFCTATAVAVSRLLCNNASFCNSVHWTVICGSLNPNSWPCQDCQYAQIPGRVYLALFYMTINQQGNEPDLHQEQTCKE